MTGASPLAGRIAVVIGGGGSIGGACAHALAGAGARVAIVDRDASAANAVATPLEAFAHAADCGDEASLFAARDAIERALGPADILIHSSAVFQSLIPAAALPMRKWDEVVRVDQRGVFLACRIFGETMIAQGGGAIVNVASVAGMRSFPLHAYAAAKAAVIAMSSNLAAEWGASGVRVNALSPGFTRTAAVQAAIDGGSRHDRPMVEGTPLGRLVEPEEVAQAALFLASPAASAITGINLPVDCGWLVGAPWQAYGGLGALQTQNGAGS